MRASLHILTDTVLQSRFTHLDLARMALEGGADVVQYRNKAFDRERDGEELRAIVRLCAEASAHLVVNDDPELALWCGAAGVHVGREDAPAGEARHILGPKALVGATVHDRQELEALNGLELDYIGVGPVYGSRSKDTGLPDLGTDGLAALCALSPFPVIAIGGISPENTKPVLEAGAAGIALISAFCKADDPVYIAKAFREILDTHFA